MCTFRFPCIMTMVPSFANFFIFILFIFKYFFDIYFHFDRISAVFLLITSLFLFLKLIISIACSLKDSQKLFMQSLSLYTSCLFSILLNNDTKKPDGIYSPNFVVDDFSGLFLHSLTFSTKHSRSA